MSVPIIAFFNNKGGVGKTSLIYHLTWMYADLGVRVVAADLDPQANLTAAFLDEERLEELWPNNNHAQTVYGSIEPLCRGIGDIATPYLEHIGDIQASSTSPIALLPGDFLLFQFEDRLSEAWPKCMDGDPRAFRVISAFWRMMQEAAKNHKAHVILVDLGPNLGFINRSALIAIDYVVIPLSLDLFSLPGLRNLGSTLREWRSGWQDRRAIWRKLQEPTMIHDLELPEGKMQPIGYIILQHAVRMDRPVKAYDRWIARIPQEYRTSVLGEQTVTDVKIADDPNYLALLKHYRSLMPLAQEAHKPIFHLKPADGALGSHMQAVRNAYKDFEGLARTIAQRINLTIPTRE